MLNLKKTNALLENVAQELREAKVDLGLAEADKATELIFEVEHLLAKMATKTKGNTGIESVRKAASEAVQTCKKQLTMLNTEVLREQQKTNGAGG